MGSCDHDWQYTYTEDDGDNIVYHYQCTKCDQESTLTVSKGDLEDND